MSMAKGPKLGYDDLNHLAEHPSNLLFRIGINTFGFSIIKQLLLNQLK